MCLYNLYIYIYTLRSCSYLSWGSDMQLKVIQFLHGYLVRVSHYIVGLSILPFWPEMARMMILSDCYQVNLMIDHKPARLKIGFINFTAISEYYLLWLRLFFLPAGRELGIIVLPTQRVCHEIKLFSASSRILSITSHGDIATFAYNANFILVKQIYSSRCKIFMFGMLQIWHGVSSLIS